MPRPHRKKYPDPVIPSEEEYARLAAASLERMKATTRKASQRSNPKRFTPLELLFRRVEKRLNAVFGSPYGLSRMSSASSAPPNRPPADTRATSRKTPLLPFYNGFVSLLNSRAGYALILLLVVLVSLLLSLFRGDIDKFRHRNNLTDSRSATVSGAAGAH